MGVWMKDNYTKVVCHERAKIMQLKLAEERGRGK